MVQEGLQTEKVPQQGLSATCAATWGHKGHSAVPLPSSVSFCPFPESLESKMECTIVNYFSEKSVSRPSLITWNAALPGVAPLSDLRGATFPSSFCILHRMLSCALCVISLLFYPHVFSVPCVLATMPAHTLLPLWHLHLEGHWLFLLLLLLCCAQRSS